MEALLLFLLHHRLSTHMQRTQLCTMQMCCFVLHNSILPYAHLLIVTKSVTKWQTSVTFRIATKSGYSLVRRRGVAFFGERVPEWSPQAFMTNCLTGLDLMWSSLHLLLRGVGQTSLFEEDR